MTKFQASQRRSEQGFTLVELAIVMVIIGLLIGGILKGQELIATAKIASTVSQVKSLDAALNTFQEKYNALPGDIPQPANRLPNCASAPCNVAGTGGTIGNGRIEGGAAVANPGLGTEAGLAFVHLNAADLISGINPNGGATFGGQFPAVKAGGGMWVAYAPGNGTIANTTLPQGRHYVSLAGDPANANTATSGSIPVTAAAQIDRKLDDGIPQGGQTQTMGTGCFNGAAGTSTYNEGANGGTCTMYIRALN